MKARTDLALLFALMTVFFWGISFVATKVVVKEIPPITLAVLRFSLSLLLLEVIVISSRRREKFSKEGRKNAILAGFWGVSMYFIFENVGVKFTTPSQASLLISSVPIFTIMIQDVQRKRRSSSWLYLMSFVSFFGVALIVFANGLKFNYSMLGDLFILLAALSWGMYTLYVDKLGNTDNLFSTFEMTKWGLLFLLPFSAMEFVKIKPTLSSFVQPNLLLMILFLGILCSGLGYVMWNYAIRVLGSRTTNNLLYLIPLVSVATDSIILKNPPSLSVYVGGGFIMFGVVMGERLARKEDLKALD